MISSPAQPVAIALDVSNGIADIVTADGSSGKRRQHDDPSRRQSGAQPENPAEIADAMSSASPLRLPLAKKVGRPCTPVIPWVEGH
jgi:hypothetical protein